MKRTVKYLSCLFLFLSICFGCTPKEQVAEDDIIRINVTEEYPKKKMVLQDMASVEYIRLETPENLLWKGQVNALTDRYIINHQSSTGDVLFFERIGQGIKKMNRQGSGNEEYSPYSNFLFDEEKNELYFDDPYKRKIFVYDLDGAFKRMLESIPNKRYQDLTHFDSERLIVYNNLSSDEETNSYLILSKKTGEIEQELTIPQTGRKISTRTLVSNGDNSYVIQLQDFPLMTSFPDFILTDRSNDTIFSMNRSMELIPFVIQRPSRSVMDPEVFLFYSLNTRDYLFLYTVEKKFEGEGLKVKAKNRDLVYDRKVGKLFQQDIRNDDFLSAKTVNIRPDITYYSPSNVGTYVEVLNASDLMEAYENNELKGELKEITQKLGEEDNPVLLIARFE